MSDAPIYERMARRLATNPLSEGRRPAIINDEVMTAPLTRAQEEAMRRVEKTQHEQAVAILAEVGLHPYDIVQPTYRRIVYNSLSLAGIA